MSGRRNEPPDLLRHAGPWLSRFAPDQPHLIGVSGGRDSVALLHALVAHGYCHLIVCHLDHQLRPESGDDARFVEGLARHWHLEAVSAVAKVAARATKRKESIETAAREARYEFFSRVARQRGCPRLFLGHHADDQVETFFFNLLRGSGSAGLGAMRPLSGEREGLELARPLLGVWREEIDSYIAAHHLEFREDASNTDPRFTRNRLRHEIIPALSAAFGRDVRRAIWRAAEILRDEDLLIASLPELAEEHREMPVAWLRERPAAMQRRIVHRWLKAGGIANVGFEEVEAVRRLLTERSAQTNLPGGWHARRRAGLLFLEPPPLPR
ncbi:MAG: tRNA(Ile)-lysidine synthase [Chthoniobacter sp.]|jgi:tRNA(Ile)-lysidine synthase|nr:tRNA(Ile)-lysidine synthase [Chthoniobacter sp.]